MSCFSAEGSRLRDERTTTCAFRSAMFTQRGPRDPHRISGRHSLRPVSPSVFGASFLLVFFDRRRRAVYRLYHVLNHYNLFGGGYQAQALALLEEIAA